MSDRFDNKLKRKLESNAEEVAGSVSAVRADHRRAARRRRWSSDEKARIVMESLRPGANVSEVARRNGLSPKRLFAWRREAHALFEEGANPVPADRAPTAPVPQPPRRKQQHEPPEIGTDTPMFAPVVIAASSPSSPPLPSQPAPANAGRIEIAIGNTVVRVIGQVETAMLMAVPRAVRGSS
jgi:transposase